MLFLLSRVVINPVSYTHLDVYKRQDLDKIKKQKADFIKFEVLKNFESFEIMERFVDQLNDEKFKSELELSLIHI